MLQIRCLAQTCPAQHGVHGAQDVTCHGPTRCLEEGGKREDDFVWSLRSTESLLDWTLKRSRIFIHLGPLHPILCFTHDEQTIHERVVISNELLPLEMARIVHSEDAVAVMFTFLKIKIRRRKKLIHDRRVKGKGNAVEDLL